MFILSNHTNGEFINTLSYLEYHGEEKFDDASTVIFDDGNKPVFVFLAAKTKAGFIHSHPGTTFCGPIHDLKESYSELKIYVDLIEEHYKKTSHGLIVKLTPSYYMSTNDDLITYIFLSKGYSIENFTLSNVIDLRKISTDEDLLSSYHSNRRNQVRKSMKNGFVFSVLNIINKQSWNNLSLNLEKRYGVMPTHSLVEIRKLHGKFYKNIDYYEVSQNEVYGASAIVYRFKNVFHTQYLDMNFDLRHEYPNLFLIHNLIELAKNEGFSFFSFGSSTESGGKLLNESLYGFKRQFGSSGYLSFTFKKVF